MNEMKSLITTIVILSSLKLFAQRDIGANNSAVYKRIYEYAYVEKKPFFAASKDSLRSYYLSHFIGFDSLLQRAISNGDTAKYIRVHFEFVVDEYGVPYDASFTYIGSKDMAVVVATRNWNILMTLNPTLKMPLR